MAGEILNPGIGFLFWIIASQLYPADTISLAVGLISAMMLLSMLSKLGFDVGTIRFLPEAQNASRFINSVLSIAGIMSLLLGCIFILGTPLWSPALLILQENTVLAAIFIIGIMATSLYTLQDCVAISMRNTQYTLNKNIINGLGKLALIIAFASLGLAGLFGSWVAAMLLGSLGFSLFFMPKLVEHHRFRPTFDRALLKRLLPFTAGNYVVENLRELPRNLLPLIVVNVLAAEGGAYFYMAWMVANILFMLAYSVSMAVISESAHDLENINQHLGRAAGLMIGISAVGAVGIMLFGDFVLSLFGPAYVENASFVLKLFALSGIPVALNYVFLSSERIQKKNTSIVLGYACIGIVSTGFTILMAPSMGINAVGYGWLLAQCIASILFGSIYVTQRWSRRRSAAA